MSEDFRRELHWKWAVKRFWDAVADEQKAGDALERFLVSHNVYRTGDPRPPCICKENNR